MAPTTRSLGTFKLVGIPPAPRGVPQIEVTFDIDANGILMSSAKDKATGKEQKIRIQADIDQMVKDAEANAEADKAKREAVEAKNSAEAMINSVEKQLSEYGDKLSPADKGAIEDAVKAAKEAVDGGDVPAIQEKSQALMQAAMKIGEVMYAEQQATAEADAKKDSGDDDVVDADFEEVDGDKK
jgi:molecular chaperone DnaK